MKEFKHTKDELKYLQSQPLERKILITQTRIMEWYNKCNNQVVVNFSGGKDSTVLVDLVAKICAVEKIPLYLLFVDTGLEFPEIRKFVKYFPVYLRERESNLDITLDIIKPKMRFDEVIKIYGWNYPSKEVAEAIYYNRRGSQWAKYIFDGLDKDGNPSKFKERYRKYKYLVDSPFIISAKCCKIMKEAPIDEYCRETERYSMIATMASESKRRENSWLQTGCNAFDSKKPISKPLSFWIEQDILQYLKVYDLPYASVYGGIIEEVTSYKRKPNKSTGKLLLTGEQRTGCMFCPVGCHLDKPNKFQRMKETHPARYNYCMRSVEDGGLGLGEFLDYIGVKYE